MTLYSLIVLMCR